MNHLSRTRLLTSLALSSVMALGASRDAHAQEPWSTGATPSAETIKVGSWSVRPILEVRVRGEYKRSPADTGGDRYGVTAVLHDDLSSNVPPLAGRDPLVSDQYLVGERSRLGLEVSRGAVSAVLTLQDARVLGVTGASAGSLGGPGLPSFGPWEAYLDLRTKGARGGMGTKAFVRLGRQKVVWGDGRLLGESDFSPTARSLDALRAGVSFWKLDVEALAALLAPPGGQPPQSASSPSAQTGTGTGAQLYGLDATLRIHPLFNVEALGLFRFVRPPVPVNLVPSDTFTVDGRVFGAQRGFSYALEGAYQTGTVASYGENRAHEAFAFAGKVGLETRLPGRLGFYAQGGYASGDDGDGRGKLGRFDPLLPEEYENLGKMGLYAWSNNIELGGDVTSKPSDEVALQAGYRYVMLADARDRWVQSAGLLPVGGNPTGASQELGHEVDVRLRATPWDAVRLDLGYGLFVYGAAAKGILERAGRSDAANVAELQHWGYLQATVRVP